jgi:hypothetical protein
MCETLKASYFKTLCAKKPEMKALLDKEADKADLVKAVEFLKRLVMSSNIFIRISANQILSSIDGKVALTEHNCVGKCIVAENGSDEAFVAGFLKASADEKSVEDKMEYASFVMISALKSELNVNPELSEAMLKRMQQNHFVSYKPVEEKAEETPKEEL